MNLQETHIFMNCRNDSLIIMVKAQIYWPGVLLTWFLKEAFKSRGFKFQENAYSL